MSAPLDKQTLTKTVESGLLRLTVTFELLREPKDEADVREGFTQMADALDEYIDGLRMTQKEPRHG